MTKSLSVSVARGRFPAPQHTKRDYTPPNAAWSLRKHNVVIKSVENEREELNAFFADSISAFNAKQSRPCRHKSYDYYEELLQSSQQNPLYEYVIQFGNRSSIMSVTDDDFDDSYWNELMSSGKHKQANAYAAEHYNNSEDRQALREGLIELGRKLPELYPNFHFLNIVLHDDEVHGTAHLQVDFFPVADGYKTGMPVRSTLVKALSQMGYNSDKEGGYSVKSWQNDLKSHMTEILEAKGFEREYMDNSERRLEVADYIRSNATGLDDFLDHAEEVAQALEGVQEELKEASSELSAAKKKTASAKKQEKESQEKRDSLNDETQRIWEEKKLYEQQLADAQSGLAVIERREAAVDEREDAVAKREIALGEKQYQFEQDAARKKKIIARFCKAKFGTSDVYDELETELIKAERSHEIRHRPMIDTSGIEGGSGIDFSLRPY